MPTFRSKPTTIKVFEIPPVAWQSHLTCALFGQSDETQDHRIQPHKDTTEPSVSLNYPQIVQGREEDALVKQALAVCKGHTLLAIENQVHCGQKIHFEDLKRGDVVVLCTSHDVYGQSARRYMYWGKTTVDSDERLVFLTLVTYEKEGVEVSPYWFLKHVSYRLRSGPRLASKAFVSWTQAVVIKPKHDYIVGVRERSEAESKDFRAFVKFMEHLLNSHGGLVSYLSTLNHKATSYSDTQARGDAYCKVRDTLKTLKGKGCPVECSVDRALRDELGKYPKNNKWSNDYFPIKSQHSRGFKPNNGKCQPPKDLCELLTGQAVRFCANNHKIVGN
ncbi:hypothetical protein FAUST_3230 [Fusarium austroamericanum]|uniref:Uncharacterized protein n=1 Tax=Fusarium austroamericanum TaxID=282268 RepID=A0AAN6C5E4_FUSAU|nr:hypothetical protein FAUST_3230 [Fusarium austroamericanum]